MERKTALPKSQTRRRPPGNTIKVKVKSKKTKTTVKVATRPARLDVRISPQLRAEVLRAAEIRGNSITEFVTHAVLQAARSVIDEMEIIRLSKANQKRFAAAILDPPRPLNDALLEAFALHKARVRE